jgi:hypothetical protein
VAPRRAAVRVEEAIEAIETFRELEDWMPGKE